MKLGLCYDYLDDLRTLVLQDADSPECDCEIYKAFTHLSRNFTLVHDLYLAEINFTDQLQDEYEIERQYKIVLQAQVTKLNSELKQVKKKNDQLEQKLAKMIEMLEAYREKELKENQKLEDSRDAKKTAVEEPKSFIKMPQECIQTENLVELIQPVKDIEPSVETTLRNDGPTIPCTEIKVDDLETNNLERVENLEEKDKRDTTITPKLTEMVRNKLLEHSAATPPRNNKTDKLLQMLDELQSSLSLEILPNSPISNDSADLSNDDVLSKIQEAKDLSKRKRLRTEGSNYSNTIRTRAINRFSGLKKQCTVKLNPTTGTTLEEFLKSSLKKKISSKKSFDSDF